MRWKSNHDNIKYYVCTYLTQIWLFLGMNSHMSDQLVLCVECFGFSATVLERKKSRFVFLNCINFKNSVLCTSSKCFKFGKTNKLFVSLKI